MIIKIIYGLLMVLVGFLIIKHRRTVKSWTGNFVWAERYLGNGGTHLVILLAGMILIFYGTTYPFGGHELLSGN